MTPPSPSTGPAILAGFCEESCQTRARMDAFISALWRRHPGVRSEAELAKVVAADLAQQGEPTAERTVRYWLRRETTPHFRHHDFVRDALSGAGRPQ